MAVEFTKRLLNLGGKVRKNEDNIVSASLGERKKGRAVSSDREDRQKQERWVQLLKNRSEIMLYKRG